MNKRQPVNNLNLHRGVKLLRRSGKCSRIAILHVRPHIFTVTDALGRETKYYYTRKYGTNLVTKMEGVCGCGGGGSEVTQYFYDLGSSAAKPC